MMLFVTNFTSALPRQMFYFHDFLRVKPNKKNLMNSVSVVCTLLAPFCALVINLFVNNLSLIKLGKLCL